MIDYTVRIFDWEDFYKDKSNQNEVNEVTCPYCKEEIQICCFKSNMSSHYGNAICPECKKDYYFNISFLKIAYKEKKQ